MRATQTCPKCTGRRFAVIAELRLPAHDSSNGIQPFPVATVETEGGWIAHGRVSVGHFETWVCHGCGYTEFYARDQRQLVQLAEQHPEQVRIVDASGAAQGPFR